MVASQSSPAENKVDINYDPVNDFDVFLDPKENAGLVATFYKFAEKNNFESTKENRPVFDEKVFIRIERVGDKLSVNEREATDFDKARFADEYSAYLRGDTQVGGVPIETLPGLNTARVAELKSLKIHSIEGLAAVPDSSLRYLGHDAHALRQKAIAFMEALRESRGDVAIEAIRKEASEAMGQGSARMDVLEQQVAGLGAQLGGLGDMLTQLLQNQAAAVNTTPAPAASPIAPETPATAGTPEKDIL